MAVENTHQLREKERIAPGQMHCALGVEARAPAKLEPSTRLLISKIILIAVTAISFCKHSPSAKHYERQTQDNINYKDPPSIHSSSAHTVSVAVVDNIKQLLTTQWRMILAKLFRQSSLSALFCFAFSVSWRLLEYGFSGRDRIQLWRVQPSSGSWLPGSASPQANELFFLCQATPIDSSNQKEARGRGCAGIWQRSARLS